MEVDLIIGDTTRQRVDAIVTAANRRLRGGSGVNGAVHAAAGPQLLQASLALAPCEAGSASSLPRTIWRRSSGWSTRRAGVLHRARGPRPVDARLLLGLCPRG